MIKLPYKTILELKQIYKDEFNTEMADEAAKAEAQRFLIFFYQYLIWLGEYEIKDSLRIVTNSNCKISRILLQMIIIFIIQDLFVPVVMSYSTSRPFSNNNYSFSKTDLCVI